MIEEARALYAADPTRFVSERTMLTRLLRSAGREDDASAVAALRRPKLSEWAEAQRVLDDRQARLGAAQDELDAIARQLASADPAGQA